MWNKKGGEGFAAVCGGYTAHKVGLTNTFAGTKQLNKLYTYIPPDIDIFTNFKGYLEIKGYLELMEQASTKPQRAKILAAEQARAKYSGPLWTLEKRVSIWER